VRPNEDKINGFDGLVGAMGERQRSSTIPGDALWLV
jgi:hypothetical protein